MKPWLRSLGDSGIKVSAVGLGTVKLGRDRGVKYPERFIIPDDSAALSLLEQARELGINLLDTAPAYGNSETRLGELLRGRRQDWVICTKVGEEFKGVDSYFDFSAAHTRYSIERSLRRLKTDYLDVVLVHSDGRDELILDQGEVLGELERAKTRGDVRAIGMSTKTVAGGCRAARSCDAVMVTYHPGYREEEPVLDACSDSGCGVMLKKVLASGHLDVADADPAGTALRFALAHPATDTAIIGTINSKHLAANVAAAKSACSAGSAD